MFPANIRKKALCVGIAYENQSGPYGNPPDFELAGSHNDVRGILGLLRDYYDYKDFTILLDAEGYTKPTRANILSAMNALIDDARPGDNLFFFYAGHGDQITNLNGTEDDGLDEIILPIDWHHDNNRPKEDRDRYSNIITDDEMNEILVQRLPPSCRLTALFDTCHSGTILDLPYTRFCGPPLPNPSEGHPSEGHPSEEHIISTFRTASPLSVDEMDVSVDEMDISVDEMDVSVDEMDVSVDEMDVSVDEMDVDSEDGVSSLPYSRPQSFSSVLDPDQIGRPPLASAHSAATSRAPYRGTSWRDGSWIVRGETYDHEVHDQAPLKNAVSWSACSDGQTGYETESVVDGKHFYSGVMVEAFVTILKENPYRTYRELLQRLGNKIKLSCNSTNSSLSRADWVIQEPQLGSHQKPDLDRLFAP